MPRAARSIWSCPIWAASASLAASTGTRCCCPVWSSRCSGCSSALIFYTQLKNLPVHSSMLEVSELIYETCKTYLVTQGKFILLLELFVGTIIVALLRRAAAPRGVPGRHHPAVQPRRHCRQLRRGVVRHPGQHLRQLAHGVCRPGGQALSRLRHPAQGGHEHRHAAHQRRAADHARASCCSFPASTPARASSALPSASRSARRRCASPAASSPRSPTSGRT